MEFSKDRIRRELEIACADAAQNVADSEDVIEFKKDLSKNLNKLANDLFNRRYDTGYLKCFIIEDPVKREVFAPNFRDRVVSHFVYNLLIPIFERTFIYDAYSCRVGKGTHFGVERAEHMVRSCSNNYQKPTYILQLDISGYFMSIDTKILYRLTSGIIEKYKNKQDKTGNRYSDSIDFDLVNYIVKILIFRNPLKKCIKIGWPHNWIGLPPNKSLLRNPKGIGIIIGDLMSQVFSNVYLTPFDKYITEYKGIKYYGRYVDDAFVLSNDKESLKKLIPDFIEFLKKELHLTLHKHKTRITPIEQGFTFLGFDIKPHRLNVRKRTEKRLKKRFYETCKALPTNLSDTTKAMIDKTLATFNSCFGHLRHGYTYNFRKDLIEKNKKVIDKYFEYEESLEKFIIKKTVKDFLKNKEIKKKEKSLEREQRIKEIIK